MSQNRSTAVMQRRIEPPDSLDYFPTPAWAGRALCERLQNKLHQDLATQTCWEPACGEGYLARGLSCYFKNVILSDIHDYGIGAGINDFTLDTFNVKVDGEPFDWVVTNPPFNCGTEFVRAALRHARIGVAMFVRSGFLEGGERYSQLFAPTPPTLILHHAERVLLLKGRMVRPGSIDPLTGKKATTSATAYSWLVWLKPWLLSYSDSPTNWIPPCRGRLELPTDYDPPRRLET